MLLFTFHKFSRATLSSMSRVKLKDKKYENKERDTNNNMATETTIITILYLKDMISIFQ